MKELSGRKPCKLIAVLRGWKCKAGELGGKEAGGKNPVGRKPGSTTKPRKVVAAQGAPIFRFVAKWTMRPVSG